MIVRNTTSHTTGKGNWIRPFGPLVYSNTVSKMMVDEINYFAKNSKIKYNHNLAGNIEQELSFKRSNQFEEELKSFVLDYIGILNEQQEKTNSNNTQPFIHVYESWINVQKRGEWQPTHAHGGEFSCILYSKIPEELKNEWMHPTQQGNYPTGGKIEFRYGEELHSSRCSMLMTPHEGQILLFPAWLHHNVYPFHSDVERISFSTNFKLQY